jgi:hypothetical protein
MSAISDKERWVANLCRLRRAERELGVSPEIRAVKADLERAVGATVPRAMAARLLRVSQTALDRWISLGDVPAVLTPAGRREVPLRALVELVELLQERRRAEADRHPLASLLRERRSAAERLDVAASLPAHCRRRELDDHRAAELRGLVYHRAVAARLSDQLVQAARERIRRWRSEGRIDPRYAQRWEEVLAQKPAQIAKLIAQDTQLASDLRQSSPFAGVLSEPERRHVLAAVGAASA